MAFNSYYFIFTALLIVGNHRMVSAAQSKVCTDNACSSKSSNGKCDSECNLQECQFDGYECSFGLDPWKLCNTTSCVDNFHDGSCSQECNNEQCLYDGFDCVAPLANCSQTSSCLNSYDDDICNDTCNTRPCASDGYDCRTGDKGVLTKLLGSVTVQYMSTVDLSLSQEAAVLGYTWSLRTRAGFYMKRYQNNYMAYEVSTNNFKLYYDVDAREQCGFSSGNCWTRIDALVNLIAADAWKIAKQTTSNKFAFTSFTACSYDGVSAPNCMKDCNKGCQDNVCNMELGFCECASGYAGPSCTTECPSGCKITCNVTDTNSPCIGSCNWGYVGTYCNESCSVGKWGLACAYNCSTKCTDGKCNAATGFCLNGCKEGHSGQFCTSECPSECPSHLYGEGCKMTCGYCKMNISCNALTGICTNGCGAGKQGSKCDQDCAVGTFGNGCTGTCDGCINKTCNAATGVCALGCVSADRVGSKCLDPSTVTTTSSTVSAGIIAGVVISLILIIGGVVIGIFLWKRSKANLFNTNLTKREDQRETEAPVAVLSASSEVQLVNQSSPDDNTEQDTEAQNTAHQNHGSKQSLVTAEDIPLPSPPPIEEDSLPPPPPDDFLLPDHGDLPPPPPPDP